VLTILDTGQNPEAKGLLLSGQVNIAACPQCGNAGMLHSPMVYHDPEKELLFTHVPPELGLPETEQQRIVGDLTNRVMGALPAEKRKGYLLRPRAFLRLEGMIEAILEADGITPEMLEAQRAKADLLGRLLRATSEEAREIIARENDGRLDYEFYQLLSLNIELAQAQGQDEEVKQLLRLREQLLGWTSTGREIAAREKAIKSLGPEITREGLLEKVIEAALAGEPMTVETLVSIARPAIDYIFYQQLTQRIEAAQQRGDADEAKTLKELRETILTLTAEIDAELQEATEQAAQLLQEVMASPEPGQVLRENLDQMDELFLGVLAEKLREAQRAGRTEEAGKLEEIGETLSQIILESQPPEIQLINRLLGAAYPDGTRALLEKESEQVDSRLVEIMKLVGQDLQQRGRQEAAERLARIQEQAASMLGSPD
jgi:hypothetical protein